MAAGATPEPTLGKQPPEETYVLEVQEAVKSFGLVQALRGVSLGVARGEVLGVVGANGAGKSTLIRILTGDLRPDSGTVLIDGTEVELKSVRDAQRLGVGVVRQELDLVPDLTIAENIFLAEERRFGRRGVVDRRSQHAAASPLLEAVGLDLSPATRVARLSIGDRQLVAAARAMRDAGTALLLDEPTSSLSPLEAARLFRTVRNLAQRGVAVVHISHRLDEVAELCDRVVVIRDGAVGGRFDDPAKQGDEIVTAMVPGLAESSHRPSASQSRVRAGEVVLSVRGLVVGRHGPASFDVHRGEVVGLFGLVGAGRSTIGRALCGIIPPTDGVAELAGRSLSMTSPDRGFGQGIAYLSEDRKGESILPGMTLRTNICVRTPRDTATRGILRFPAMRRLAAALVDRLKVVPRDSEIEIQKLSGGNQQKVVLSRLLAETLDVVVLDEPTHGIDISAKRDLVDLLREMAEQGMGVVFISSELPELISACDRLLVMARGRVVRAVDPRQATEPELIGAAAQSGLR